MLQGLFGLCSRSRLHHGQHTTCGAGTGLSWLLASLSFWCEDKQWAAADSTSVCEASLFRNVCISGCSKFKVIDEIVFRIVVRQVMFLKNPVLLASSCFSVPSLRSLFIPIEHCNYSNALEMESLARIRNYFNGLLS